MKAVLSLTLGVMTAIGGFVDIGNLVTSGITGARFGMTLAWAVLVGTLGMALFAEMAGRVTAVTRKPIFHVVREWPGVRVSLVNAGALSLLNLLTLAAELGGVSLVLQMVTGISYLIWVPLARLDGRHVDGGGAVLIVLTGFRGRGLCSVRQRLAVRRPGGLRTGPGPASRCLPGAGSWTLARSVSQTYRHGSGPAAEGHVSGTFVMPLNARPSAGRVL